MSAGHGDASQPDHATTAPEPAADSPFRVTTLELFFDLIFAFTLTQLTVVLTPGLTAERVIRVLLIFCLLWWMYGGYAWLTNTRAPGRTPERLLLVLGMAGFLIVGLAIPAGFGHDGIALGVGYLLVVGVHAVLYARVNPHIWRIAPFNVASALLVIAAGFIGGGAAYGFWVAALAIQAGAPLVVRLGGRFEIRPDHFAERHGALIIVAIGESVAAIGIGASGLAVDARLVVAAVAGLALSAELWWLYFGSGDDEAGEQAMRGADPARRPGLALSAYFYAHMPMLLGTVFVAAGVAAEVTEAAGHGGAGGAGGAGRGGASGLAAALALGVGTAAFVSGTAAFRAALRIWPVQSRLTAAIFALATIPLGALVAIEAQLGLVIAGLAIILTAERTARPVPPAADLAAAPPPPATQPAAEAAEGDAGE